MSSNTADSSSSLLQALGHPLSDRRLQVLRALGECGSISQAARAVGVSYKAAWQAIDTLSNLAGVPVVQKSVGGAGGGGARLTEAGQELLRAAEALAQAKGAVMQQLQSRLPVQRLGIQTSMRNQWPCMVQQLAMSGPLAQVHLQGLHADVTVQARITAESAQLLAMCKATAVEVTAATASLAQGNSWQGKIARITPGALGDEVAVQLSPGMQWVGFAAAHTGWRVGRRVQVHVPEAAVVLALEGGMLG